MKKFTAILLTVLMLLTVLPVSAAAAGIEQAAMYRKMWRDTDAIWAEIDETVARMDARSASRDDIIKAIYNIAAEGEGIVSCEIEGENVVHFVHESGMENAYDWRVNHAPTAVPARSEGFTETTLKSLQTATDLDVLLLGPYYGYDSSFTNQYRNEVQSIANYTEGAYTIYGGHDVTAAACRAAEDYGVIIFDSHGSCVGGRSYLCLTTSEGFTNEDYSNNRALRSGGEAWVTGAFWEYYCPDMKAACVWMAICEGMMTNTLGQPLLNAGCAVVYGYSQSVTFAGDYMYEATFWNHMKQGETFAESYDAMIAAHGIDDPYGNAYPVTMSEDDAYPANPDSHQTVYCQWHLPKPSDLVVTDATGVHFEQDSYGIAPTFSEKLIPVITPEGANNFTTSWTSSDPSVATVTKNGTVTGVTAGTAVITFTMTSTQYSNTQYTYSASATVTVSNSYLPADVMYVPVDTLIPGETYLIGCSKGVNNVVMSNEYYDANNGRSLKTSAITMGELGGVACVASGASASEEWTWTNEGYLKSAENGLYLNLTGNYLSIGNTPVVWSYEPTPGATTGVITNNANANFKYLGVSNTLSYFGVFLNSSEMQLYRKLVRAAEQGVAGDANGDSDLTSADALLILRYANGDHSAIPADSLALCDMNGDGIVNSADALIVLRMAMGL
ncbi:MAG: Ig-like domain-containing protein [Clostridia bacterium]|nr:Ig-like domain-containing protein [Clostridia bacterium]